MKYINLSIEVSLRTFLINKKTVFIGKKHLVKFNSVKWLLLKPQPRPSNPTLKILDHEKPGPLKTWSLKNMDSEKPGL